MAPIHRSGLTIRLRPTQNEICLEDLVSDLVEATTAGYKGEDQQWDRAPTPGSPRDLRYDITSGLPSLSSLTHDQRRQARVTMKEELERSIRRKTEKLASAMEWQVESLQGDIGADRWRLMWSQLLWWLGNPSPTTLLRATVIARFNALIGADRASGRLAVHTVDGKDMVGLDALVTWASDKGILVEQDPLPGCSSSPVQAAYDRLYQRLATPVPGIEPRKREGNVWGEQELLDLYREAAEPGMTHEKLGEKYGVSRQQIGKLLKKAKETFGPRKASVFDALGPGRRKP